jgi:uncharacterized protein with HEPN domain
VPPRPVLRRLRDIAEALERIRPYCDGLTFEQFSEDSRTVEAVQFNFIVIGEAARHLPDDLVAQHPGLPWAEMRGLRNIVTHAYFAVSLEILWQTISSDLPPLEPAIQALLDEAKS